MLKQGVSFCNKTIHPWINGKARPREFENICLQDPMKTDGAETPWATRLFCCESSVPPRGHPKEQPLPGAPDRSKARHRESPRHSFRNPREETKNLGHVREQTARVACRPEGTRHSYSSQERGTQNRHEAITASIRTADASREAQRPPGHGARVLPRPNGNNKVAQP